MTTLYGLTADGTSVPVQVTDNGRLVAQGLEGPPGIGEQGPPGPEGPPCSYGPDDDLSVKTVTAADGVATGPIAANDPASYGAALVNSAIPTSQGGELVVQASGLNNVYVNLLRAISGPNEVLKLDASGNLQCAGNKAGFTSAGELYFTTRGDRYRLTVQGNMVYPEPFPVELELQERAAALKALTTPDIVPPTE